MKKTLISGITGQDGSYLAELLLSKGYEVHGITRRSSSFNTGRIDHIYQDPHVSDAKVFLHFGDMTDGVGIANLITKLNPDEIYNLAAQSQVRVSFDIPEYTENVVGLGAVRILEAIRHINPKIKYYQASSCFVKGTKILTRKFIERQRYGKKQRFLTLGTKSIEDLIVGDEVLSYNEKTAKKEYKLVERISHRMSDNVFKIKFSNGNFLVASDNHPFFVIGKGWVQLKNLIVGDEVIQKQYNGLYGGIIRQGKSFEDFFGLDTVIDIIKVVSIELEDKDRMVYNIEVKDNHNFFAKGILVHNSEIFGDSPPPQNELTYMRPNSPYSVAKLSAYWNTVNYRTGYGIFACNGILFNHESPRRGETFVTRKITMAVARIKAGLQKDLFLGNMEAKRDWGYSKNYVVAMFQMMQLDKAEDIVIGTGETHTVREFVEEAFSYVDLDYRDYVKIDPRYYRPNEVNFLQADISKAKRLLNWEPKVKFKELVRLMMDADMEYCKN
jgi:GDP-D-mannose dehydratase